MRAYAQEVRLLLHAKQVTPEPSEFLLPYGN